MERAGFMTCTAASHQGAIKEPAASLFRTCEAHPTYTYLWVQQWAWCYYLHGRQAYADVGNHAIIFKSLSFGPFTLKRNPGVFKVKQDLQRFQKSPFSRVANARVV